MKKTVLFLSILCMIIASLSLTGCNKNEPEQPANVQKYHVRIEAGKVENQQMNGPRRALGLEGPEGNTLTASWAEGEQVSVRNLTKNVDLEGNLAAESSGVQTVLSGDLTGTINAGDALELTFLSPDYANQAGTLDYIASHCDYAKDTIHVASVTWGDIQFEESIASFNNKQAIVKFILKNEAKTANLSASKLEVEVDGTTYTVTPDPATSEIFVALPGFSEKTIKLTATVSGEKYTYTSPSAKTFEDGIYYIITIGMAEKNEVHPFSISPTKQIEFAHGNLQYQPSTNTWRIAREQYDFVGDECAFYSNGDNGGTELGTVYENSIKSNNLKLDGNGDPTFKFVGTDYDGWIDLFGWNTADNPLCQDLYNTQYISRTYKDWGKNTILDPKSGTVYDDGETWYTLSNEQWEYILFHRPDAIHKVGLGYITDHERGPIKGIIFLSDDFEMPSELVSKGFKDVSQTHSFHNNPSLEYYYNGTILGPYDITNEVFDGSGYFLNQNRYTVEEWKKLEAAGAVFLPAAGRREIYDNTFDEGYVYGDPYEFRAAYLFFVGRIAAYWASNPTNDDEAYNLICAYNDPIFAVYMQAPRVGQSVRLVRDL